MRALNTNIPVLFVGFHRNDHFQSFINERKLLIGPKVGNNTLNQTEQI